MSTDDPFARPNDSRPARGWVTGAVLVANAAVFAAMVARGVSAWEPSPDDLVAWGADFGPLLLAGQWWRPLTAGFLHIGLLHLGLNLYFLSAAGPTAERLVGRWGFVLTYLLSLLTAGLVSAAVQPAVVSAGASGALFGLLGLLLARTLFPWGPGTAAARGQLRRWAFQVVVINLLIGFAGPVRVDNFGHLGGLLGGLVAGLALGRPRPPGRRGGANLRLAAVGLVLVAGLAAGAWWRLDRTIGWVSRAEAGVVRLNAAIDALRAAQPAAAEPDDLRRYADALEERVLPELRAVHAELTAVAARPGAAGWVRDSSEHARLLAAAADAYARAARAGDPELMDEAGRLMDAANAQAERVGNAQR